jgi:hypothetical protein
LLTLISAFGVNAEIDIERPPEWSAQQRYGSRKRGIPSPKKIARTGLPDALRYPTTGAELYQTI